VGLATGAYSSLFLATPIVVDLTEREPAYQALTRRVVAKRSSEAAKAAAAAGEPALAGAGSAGGAGRTGGQRRPGGPAPAPRPASPRRSVPSPTGSAPATPSTSLRAWRHAAS